MFPFHTLPFTLRLVMVDPCFVASDDFVQEGVTFISDPKFVGRYPSAFVYSPCELFWYPPCTNFTKAKSIVDDFISRTVTNLQPICHFINSQLYV